MSGQKGKSGGKRNGAGRKPKLYEWRQLKLDMSYEEWQTLLGRLPKNGRDKAVLILRLIMSDMIDIAI